MTMTSTIAGTIAGTTMAATAIAGHMKNRHDKHGRGTPNVTNVG